MSEISLPRLEEPDVSVVMVLYGGGKVATRAISALAQNTEPCFELILVDNASQDDSLARVEEQVEGATVVRNTPLRSAMPMNASTPVCTSVSDCVLLMRICRVIWSPW